MILTSLSSYLYTSWLCIKRKNKVTNLEVKLKIMNQLKSGENEVSVISSKSIYCLLYSCQ